MYKYIPNDFAKKKFGLRKSEYSCGSLTILFEQVLGLENFEKFIVAQDPFYMKKIKKAVIKIRTNHNEQNAKMWNLRSIGTVEKF